MHPRHARPSNPECDRRCLLLEIDGAGSLSQPQTPRIHGELLKLGIEIGQASVSARVSTMMGKGGPSFQLNEINALKGSP
jgi:hypothetical protein